MSQLALEPTAFTWSVRECFERVDKLAQLTHDVLELLRSDRAEAPDEVAFVTVDTIDKALRAIEAQRDLIVHLCRNLKGGMALPPTPAPTKARASTPVMFTQAGPAPEPVRATVIGAWPARKTPALGPKAEAKARAAAEGLLTIEAMCKSLKIGRTRFYQLRDEGKVEAPARMASGMAFWTPAQEMRAKRKLRGSNQ